MTTTTHTGNVVIDGDAPDKTQLVVQGYTDQEEPLQEWQDDGATGLAQVTEDGRLRVGGDLDLSAPSALVEANRGIDPTTAVVKQGVQSLGVADGGVAEIDEPLVWSSTELELEGSGGVSESQTAQRALLTNANTGDASAAELRAGDFTTINQGGSISTPVGQATGVHGAVENDNTENGAYLSKAVGVEAQISNGSGSDIADASGFEVAAPINTGTIDNLYGLKVPDLTEGSTSNYAVHTGQGLAHFGDVIELVEQATPPGTPPSGYIYIYPKSDGKLYAKDDAGTEYDLTGGGGGVGLSSLTTGLVSWWSLDESSGTRDDSQGSNDLTDNNTVMSSTGLQDDAAQFTRINEESLSIADGSQSGLDITDAITIVVPIYLDSLPSTAGEGFGIVSKYDSAGQKAYRLYVRYTDDVVVFSVSHDGSANQVIAATTFGGLSIDTWYLLYARYDGVSLKLSVGDSGRLIHETDVAYSDGIYSGSSDFKIGT